MPGMRRREFITLSRRRRRPRGRSRGSTQQSSKVFRIGYVSALAANSLPKRLDAFRAALRDLG